LHPLKIRAFSRRTRKGLLYRGPVNERINGATVVKHPEFYELYKGPRLASLDAVGASGRFDHPSGTWPAARPGRPRAAGVLRFPH
jgi:hypothetical protein